METTQIVSANHSGDKEESDYDTDTTDTSIIHLPSQFRCNFKEMLQQQQYKDEDDDGMDHVILSESTSATTTTTLPIRYVLPNQQSILNYEQFLSSLLHNSNDRNKSESSGCYDDLKHVDDHYIDYGYCGGVVMDRTVETGHGDDADDIVDSGTRVKDVGIECNGTTIVYHPDQIQHCPNHPSPLMVQQNKHIPGKGGFCWDAAFILSEYMIHQITIQQPQELGHETSFPSISSSISAIPNSDPINTPDNTVRMLELGCGTGICGMYIAKHLSLLHHSNYCDSHSLRQRQPQKNYQIIITDMDGPIQSLIQDNLRKNFHYYTKDEMEQFSEYFAKHQYPPVFENDAEGNKEKQPHHATTGTATISYNDKSHPTTLITAMVLDWDDYYHATTTAATTTTTTTTETTTYDVVFGSDIVASIYDPIKLAYTIYYLCHAQSVVYISYKERLSTIHALFQTTLTQLFECVRIFNTCTGTKIFDTMDSCSGTTTNPSSASEKDREQRHHFTSRNGNPNVYIIVASHRKLHAPLHPIDDEGDSNS